MIRTCSVARRGFTIIEVVVAMFVLTTGLTIATDLVQQAMVNDQFARGRLVASQIALEKSEQFRRLDHASLGKLDEFKGFTLYKAAEAGGTGTGKMSFLVKGSLEQHTPRMKKMTVTVKWWKGAPDLQQWDKVRVKGESSFTTLIRT